MGQKPKTNTYIEDLVSTVSDCRLFFEYPWSHLFDALEKRKDQINQRVHTSFEKRFIENVDNTDKNILDDSYKLVTHFPDFPLWENRIAYFEYKFLLKVTNYILPDREIQEICY